MAITENIDVRVHDQARPLAIPTLSKVLCLGTTPGKAVQNQYRTYTNQDAVEADFDVTDNEAILSSTFFAQDEHSDQVVIVNIDRTDFRKATLTTGDAASNTEITYTSATYGTPAEKVTITQDGSTANQTLAVALTQELVVGSQASNNAIKYTSKRSPTEDVSIEYVDPGQASQALSISLVTNRAIHGTFHTITVNLATDAAGTITTTAQDILNELPNVAGISEVIQYANEGTSDGTGVVTAQAKTSIPADVTITLETSSGATPTVLSTALEVVNAVNGDPTVAEAVSASITGSGNDGTGTVSSTTKAALSRGTAKSPSELSRALGGIRRYEKINGLDPSYFLLCTSHDEVEGDRLELSNATASRRMYYATSNKKGERVEDIKTLITNMSSDRSMVLAHENEPERYPEAGLISQWAHHDPGSFTNIYKEINTFSVGGYDESEIALLHGGAPGGPGGFTIEAPFGVPVTGGSWSTNGTFADHRRNKDWLIVNIKAALMYLEINSDIVLFDPRGFADIKGVLESVNLVATDMGIWAVKTSGEPFFEVIMPDPLDVPVTKRADRNFSTPGPSVDGRLAGAVEKITVDVYASA